MDDYSLEERAQGTFEKLRLVAANSELPKKLEPGALAQIMVNFRSIGQIARVDFAAMCPGAKAVDFMLAGVMHGGGGFLQGVDTEAGQEIGQTHDPGSRGLES